MNIRQKVTSFIKVTAVTVALSSMTIMSVFAYDTTKGFVATDNKSGKWIYAQQQYTDHTQPILDEDGNVRWIDDAGFIIMNGWKKGRSLEDASVDKWYFLSYGKAISRGIRKSGSSWYLIKDMYMHTDPGIIMTGYEYPNTFVYVTKGGALHEGLLEVNGSQYYFGTTNTETNEVVPVSVRGTACYVPEKSGICAFDLNCQMLDPIKEGYDTVQILPANDDDLYAVSPGGLVIPDSTVEVSGMLWVTDSNGKVIKSWMPDSQAKVATDSNAS